QYFVSFLVSASVRPCMVRSVVNRQTNVQLQHSLSHAVLLSRAWRDAMFHPWRRTPQLALWLFVCRIPVAASRAAANAFVSLLVGIAIAPAIPSAVDSVAVPRSPAGGILGSTSYLLPGPVARDSHPKRLFLSHASS